MIAAHLTSASKVIIRVWSQNDVRLIRDVALAFDRSGTAGRRESPGGGMVGTLARTARFPADLALALSVAGIASPLCLFGNLDPDVYESEADSRERIESLMGSPPYAVALAVMAAAGIGAREPVMAVGLVAVLAGRSYRDAAELAGVGHTSLHRFVRTFETVLRAACRGERPGTAERLIEAIGSLADPCSCGRLDGMLSRLRSADRAPKEPQPCSGLAGEPRGEMGRLA